MMLRMIAFVGVALTLTARRGRRARPFSATSPSTTSSSTRSEAWRRRHRITPGTRIVSWTEDCFDGALNKPGQKPSERC